MSRMHLLIDNHSVLYYSLPCVSLFSPRALHGSRHGEPAGGYRALPDLPRGVLLERCAIRRVPLQVS